MFWPKDIIFTGFKRLMLFLWLANVVSLIGTVSENYEGHSRPACGNRSDRQLLISSLYRSSNHSRSYEQSELCTAPIILITLNVILTLSTFRHWFQLSLFQKWFSFDYLLSLVWLLLMWGYCEIISYRPVLSTWLAVYLSTHGLQALLALLHELHYYGRYVHLHLSIEDPLFDPKIISYSIFKMIYMCSYLVAHRYPQSRCAAFTYQMYKWLLIALAESACLILTWCYIRVQWTPGAIDPHVSIAALIICLQILCYAWRTERTLRLSYPLFAVLWCTTLLTLGQLWLTKQLNESLVNEVTTSTSSVGAEENGPLSRSDETLREVLRSAMDLSKSDEDSSENSGHDLNNLDNDDWPLNAQWFPFLLAGLLLSVITALGIQFARAFKQHRAYAVLFRKECTKMLTQVLDQCRNKEYFVIKYNFKIKYKCCACGGLSVELVCPDCHLTIFGMTK